MLNRYAASLLIAFTLVLGPNAEADYNRYHPHAVTLWWVIFNQPDVCLTDPGAVEQCGAMDVFGQAYLDSIAAGDPNPALIQPNTAAGLSVLYATGGVTNPSNGKIQLAASIYRTQHSLLLVGDRIVDPLGLQGGFTSDTPEVHLVVRDHGRALPEALIEQTTGFLDPFCSDPLLLVDGGRNVCRDVQFAVFAPGEAGREAVLRFTDDQPEPGAAAYLFRQSDVMQAVIETRIRDRR